MTEDGCILCANGNDLPEGETCECCGREGNATGLRAAIIKARGRQVPPSKPIQFDGEPTKVADLATSITALLPEPAKELGDLESITLTLYVGEIREVLKVARGASSALEQATGKDL